MTMMTGIAQALDLLKKNLQHSSSPSSSSVRFHSSFFSTPVSGIAFAPQGHAFLPDCATSASQFLRLTGLVAYADAAINFDEVSKNPNVSSLFKFPGYEYPYKGKIYNVQRKSIFSTFQPKTLGLITLRVLMVNYIPLLEQMKVKEDDFEDTESIDFVAPLKHSVKQIGRELTVLTTRRILEKAVVYYASDRVAWKLLKDLPKSAERKAGRQMPCLRFVFGVSKTTFRGHMLGVAAAWLVQVGIDIYQYFYNVWNHSQENTIELLERSQDDDNELLERSQDDDNAMLEGGRNQNSELYKSKQLLVLRKRMLHNTVRCTSSLVFASIGAGVGAVIIRPSTGQWIGLTLGELAGQYVGGLLIQSLD